MTKVGDNTFVKITNKDIYDKVEEICEHVKNTNGKVKLNKWIASTALFLVLALFTLVVKIAMVCSI